MQHMLAKVVYQSSVFSRVSETGFKTIYSFNQMILLHGMMKIY